MGIYDGEVFFFPFAYYLCLFVLQFSAICAVKCCSATIARHPSALIVMNAFENVCQLGSNRNPLKIYDICSLSWHGILREWCHVHDDEERFLHNLIEAFSTAELFAVGYLNLHIAERDVDEMERKKPRKLSTLSQAAMLIAIITSFSIPYQASSASLIPQIISTNYRLS